MTSRLTDAETAEAIGLFRLEVRFDSSGCSVGGNNAELRWAHGADLNDAVAKCLVGEDGCHPRRILGLKRR